jgi:hypothetical protein
VALGWRMPRAGASAEAFGEWRGGLVQAVAKIAAFLSGHLQQPDAPRGAATQPNILAEWFSDHLRVFRR